MKTTIIFGICMIVVLLIVTIYCFERSTKQGKIKYKLVFYPAISGMAVFAVVALLNLGAPIGLVGEAQNTIASEDHEGSRAEASNYSHYGPDGTNLDYMRGSMVGQQTADIIQRWQESSGHRQSANILNGEGVAEVYQIIVIGGDRREIMVFLDEDCQRGVILSRGTNVDLCPIYGPQSLLADDGPNRSLTLYLTPEMLALCDDL